MKILILQSELGILRGGGENFTRNLFSAFAERGHRVKAAFIADHQGNYPIPLPSNIEPIPLPGWWSRNLGQTTLSSIGRRFLFRNGFRTKWDRLQEAVSWRTIRWHDRRFRKTVERHFSRSWDQFDAVYVHGSADLASSIAKFRPTILRLPGPVTSELEPLLRSVHAVCANGDALYRIRAFLGSDAMELPVGINSQLFTPGASELRSSLGWADHDYVVGYVGRLTHLKGVDLLAAGFRQLEETVPAARLLILGRGEQENSLRAVLQTPISQNRVHLEPDVSHEQLPDWYRAMDVLVMPSRYENFSNSILEALACGVPFLGSDVGGNRMLATMGAGLLFEAGSVSSMVDSLRKVCDSRLLLKVRAKAVSKELGKRYSWSKTAETLESILSSRLGVES